MVPQIDLTGVTLALHCAAFTLLTLDGSDVSGLNQNRFSVNGLGERFSMKMQSHKSSIFSILYLSWYSEWDTWFNLKILGTGASLESTEHCLPTLFLQPHQQHTFRISPLFDPSISGLEFSSNELMSSVRWEFEDVCSWCASRNRFGKHWHGDLRMTVHLDGFVNVVRVRKKGTHYFDGPL